MLAYDPTLRSRHALSVRSETGRQSAKGQLLEDIPRLISESGDVIGVGGLLREYL